MHCGSSVRHSDSITEYVAIERFTTATDVLNTKWVHILMIIDVKCLCSSTSPRQLTGLTRMTLSRLDLASDILKMICHWLICTRFASQKSSQRNGHIGCARDTWPDSAKGEVSLGGEYIHSSRTKCDPDDKGVPRHFGIPVESRETARAQSFTREEKHKRTSYIEMCSASLTTYVCCIATSGAHFLRRILLGIPPTTQRWWDGVRHGEDTAFTHWGGCLCIYRVGRRRWLLCKHGEICCKVTC